MCTDDDDDAMSVSQSINKNYPTPKLQLSYRSHFVFLNCFCSESLLGKEINKPIINKQ